MQLGHNQRHYHFIGIGGAGMSGIARILLEQGYEVSGSDLKNSVTLERLKGLGASVYVGHSRDNIQQTIDNVVVSTAIPSTNEELLEARERQYKIVHRGDVLADLMSEKKGIAVAGAHGKTTTTSMISLVFEKNGLDPTVIVGGEINDIGGNAKLGTGEYLVAEADESDGSFLKLSPHIAVITNIENDHLDYYGTTEKIDQAFKEFINKVPKEGYCVFCFNNKKARELAEEYTGTYITYGLETEADYRGTNVRYQRTRSLVDVDYKGDLLGTLELSVPGEHNINNALAAIVVGRLAGLSFAQVAEALKNFTGVGRRFQLTGEDRDITVVDDYAHHPTEIKATLKGARNAGFRRVIAVFQPHRFTRTKFLFKEFGEAFSDADIVIITNIYSAGEAPIEGVTAGLIVEEVEKNTAAPVYNFQSDEEIIQFLLEETRPGDLVLTLGAGNVWAVGVELVKKMRERPS